MRDTVRDISVSPTFSRVIKEAFLRKPSRMSRYHSNYCSRMIAKRITRRRCLRFAWLALWNTHVLQEMERDHVVSGNDTCNVHVQNLPLDFLRSCDEVNETRFGLLLLVSLGYVLGEMLLIIGIDTVGRKLYLSKHLRIFFLPIFYMKLLNV